MNKIVNTVINIILIVSGIAALYVVLQVFCFTTFRIPTDSMDPTLIPGDRILVNKLHAGARLFNIFSSLEGKQVAIRRAPGLSEIKHNDILVFNNPYPNGNRKKLRMDILKYYVKRCVGIPGDTISIKNGFYTTNNFVEELGYMKAEKRLSQMADEDIPKNIIRSYPKERFIYWSIKNFGPLYIPAKGDEIEMNRENIAYYKKLIEWEQQASLKIENGKLFVNDSLVDNYRFKTNYYFMAGDNVLNSQDSRYWGLLPEEFIVGKATRIWKSVDLNTDEWRWDRAMSRIR